MAKRTSGNVKGDLTELEIANLMLEHGCSINGLTASDTGWDLHCHVPDGLFRDASEAGSTITWTLTGRTAHIQVKSSGTTDLRIGTVRGWLTGTTSGVPTFLFTKHNNEIVFCSPEGISGWLALASSNAQDDDEHLVTLTGKNTRAQSRMSHHRYRADRFPSVLALWVHYPQVAVTFPEIASWMNREINHRGALDALVQDLAIAIWVAEGYTRDTESWTLAGVLAALYREAGFDDDEQRADTFLSSGELSRLTLGDGRFTMDTVEMSVVHSLDNRDLAGSAQRLLAHLDDLYQRDAAIPR